MITNNYNGNVLGVCCIDRACVTLYGYVAYNISRLCVAPSRHITSLLEIVSMNISLKYSCRYKLFECLKCLIFNESSFQINIIICIFKLSVE